jgi:ABC-2 type transport system ATP-binding protein
MIQINNLNFAYPGQQPLFSSLSVNLEAGSITGLLGKNGAGKTSLLKLITGSLFPRAGQISVLEHNPAKREVSLLNDVFLVPEEFFYPATTIGDYVRAHSSFYPRFNQTRMDNILAEFELRPNCNLQRLSHGEKKKLLIAFALATCCRLLVLDEPTNGLDIPSKALFRKILAGSLDEGQLVIISTHQVKDVENLIDKILILDNGKMIFQQTIAEISQKVSFISGTKEDVNGAIYSQETPGGYRIMVPNEHIETEVDIELLFNAIINGKKI